MCFLRSDSCYRNTRQDNLGAKETEGALVTSKKIVNSLEKERGTVESELMYLRQWRTGVLPFGEEDCRIHE